MTPALHARSLVLPIVACIPLARILLDQGPFKGLVQHNHPCFSHLPLTAHTSRAPVMACISFVLSCGLFTGHFVTLLSVIVIKHLSIHFIVLSRLIPMFTCCVTQLFMSMHYSDREYITSAL